MAEGGNQASDSVGAVGAVLNQQWKLIKLIGEGGLAAVYEAEGLQGQGRRAIKLLHPEFCGRSNVVDRFYTEAKACYTLRHPHIASVESYAYAEDGSPYIVMELLQGMSLEEFLVDGRTMAVDQAAPIAYGILQALSVAHARGIVHRDVKPANIFLVREPDRRFTPKVLDFGVAKVMDLAGGMGSKTRTGALLGTPGYMSPEQVKDAKAVDARTDLWAAAAVFFEMLTGRHPFESEDKLARMVAVLKDPPRNITQFKPELAAWEGFFQKGMAKEPEDRFQSAEEMADALRGLARQAREALQGGGRQTVELPQMPSLPLPSAQAPAADPQVVVSGMGGNAQMVYSAAGAASLPVASGEAAPSTAASPGSTRPDDKSLPIELGVPVGAPTSMSDGGASGGSAAPGPMAGAPGGPLRTQISGDKPAGTPTYISGRPPPAPVHVVTAADAEPPSLVWWGVVLVGVACLAVGLLVGYLLG